MRPILECQRLTKKYGNFYALSDLTFSLDRGQIVGLLGPNGSGKTTLIKLAAGLLVPTDGHIMINGLAPCTDTKKIVSYLPDRNFLNEHMRVRELLSFYEDFYENFSTERACKMLDSLEIDRHMQLQSLSKGTKEKVQLALVMSRVADLYILDEPIGGVDPAARDYILRRSRGLRSSRSLSAARRSSPIPQRMNSARRLRDRPSLFCRAEESF